MGKTAKVPRVVVVTRPTDYELLLYRHATRDQARFFLETRGQSIDDVEDRHARFGRALQTVLSAIPVQWRRNRLVRDDLARFVFEPDDVVVAVGQDGLVANVAKYLDGQRVVGVNADPDRNPGILVPHAPELVCDLLPATVERRVELEVRTMVEAKLDDGQRLLALNEVFIGHRTHQSARYRIRFAGAEERHSSSGVIVATGTGATGWASSVHRQRRTDVDLPSPGDPLLAFFVREAWPSVATGTEVTDGLLDAGETLDLVSEMNDDGVIFGDGIEADRLAFAWGMCATVRVARQSLNLVRA